MPDPTLEERLRVLETLDPAFRPIDRAETAAAPRRRQPGRGLLGALALVGLLVAGVVIASSGRVRSSSQPGAASGTDQQVTVGTPFEGAQIGPNGAAAMPESVSSRIAALNATLDSCLTDNGATKAPVAEGGTGGVAYDDPGGKAAAACATVSRRLDAYGESEEVRRAGAAQRALQKAYGACVLTDPNATPRDVRSVATSSAGVACRLLLNPLAGDGELLAAIVAQTPYARALDDDGHIALKWAGRTTRGFAASAFDYTLSTGQSPADEVGLVVFDGAFVPPSTPAGVTPSRARTLALVIEPDGVVGDLSIRNVEFIPPSADGVTATVETPTAQKTVPAPSVDVPPASSDPSPAATAGVTVTP